VTFASLAEGFVCGLNLEITTSASELEELEELEEDCLVGCEFLAGVLNGTVEGLDFDLTGGTSELDSRLSSESAADLDESELLEIASSFFSFVPVLDLLLGFLTDFLTDLEL
jgi:hypothetical protein